MYSSSVGARRNCIVPPVLSYHTPPCSATHVQARSVQEQDKARAVRQQPVQLTCVQRSWTGQNDTDRTRSAADSTLRATEVR